MNEGILVLAPAVIALVSILLTRRAAVSLFLAVVVGVLIVQQGNVLASSKALFAEYLFPALSGPWHVGPILFTLILGSFAHVLEASGGFRTLLERGLRASSKHAQRRGLLSVYALGLVCFFDGLANAILVGRVARPVTDRLGVSRQLLAYIVDSTSSAVACIAFISTWIATQLSLIQAGVEGSRVSLGAAEIYFRSIPANPYCWGVLSLLLVVLCRSWWVGPMRGYQAEAGVQETASKMDEHEDVSLRVVLLPLLSILVTVPGVIYLWQDGGAWSWKNAFSSSLVPQAMVAGGALSLIVACLCFPRSRSFELPKLVVEGAGALLPALLVLVLAWSLGAVFKDLKVAHFITQLIGHQVGVAWLPLVVFVVGAVTSFLTGSSWGTMGILMPLALPIGIEMSGEMDVDALNQWLPLVVGAVFGGAVFGDNCSPFSDTTIVTSLATGCSPRSHVSTQLPYALIAALAAIGAYALMAVEFAPYVATVAVVSLLILIVLLRTRRALK